MTLITVATVSIPVPNIFPNDVKVTKVLDPIYHDQFYISDVRTLNEPIEFNLLSFPESQRIIKGSKITTSGLSALTFKDNIGLIDTDDIIILKNSTFTGVNLLTRNLITAYSTSNSDIQSFQFTSDSVIELHWERDSWPSIMITKHVSEDPRLIKIILDDVRPSYDLYYNFTYRKSFTIFKGSFGCNKWIEKVRFSSSDEYFNDSSSLIFDVVCTTDRTSEDEILIVQGTRSVPISKENQDLNNKGGGIKSTSVVAISIAVIIVVCIVIGVAVFLFTRHRYEMMLQDKIKKKKLAKKSHKKSVLDHYNNSNDDSASNDEIKLEDLQRISQKDESESLSNIEDEDIPEFPHE